LEKLIKKGRHEHSKYVVEVSDEEEGFGEISGNLIS